MVSARRTTNNQCRLFYFTLLTPLRASVCGGCLRKTSGWVGGEYGTGWTRRRPSFCFRSLEDLLPFSWIWQQPACKTLVSQGTHTTTLTHNVSSGQRFYICASRDPVRGTETR